MFINTKSPALQQQNIQQYTQDSDSLSFFNQLTSPELLIEKVVAEQSKQCI